MFEDEIWYAEPMEYIRKCLSCKKPECTNCLEGVATKRQRATSVVQCHAKTLLPLATYETVYEAANQLGICPSGIYGCLNKKRKTAGGFAWFRKDELECGNKRK